MNNEEKRLGHIKKEGKLTALYALKKLTREKLFKLHKDPKSGARIFNKSVGAMLANGEFSDEAIVQAINFYKKYL